MQISDADIKTRAELSDLIFSIKAAIVAGTLRQVSSADRNGPWLDFSQLEPAGPWPDFIEAEFVDSTGLRFRLEVETYHGAGGSWRKQ